MFCQFNDLVGQRAGCLQPGAYVSTVTLPQEGHSSPSLAKILEDFPDGFKAFLEVLWNILAFSLKFSKRLMQQSTNHQQITKKWPFN